LPENPAVRHGPRQHQGDDAALGDWGEWGREVRCAPVGERQDLTLLPLFALSSYWMWSSDRSADGKAFYHYLHTGHTTDSPADYKLNARALCVRPE